MKGMKGFTKKRKLDLHIIRGIFKEVATSRNVGQAYLNLQTIGMCKYSKGVKIHFSMFKS